MTLTKDILSARPSTSPHLPPGSFEVSVTSTGVALLGVTTPDGEAAAIEFAINYLGQKFTADTITKAMPDKDSTGPDAKQTWMYARDLRLRNNA